MFLRIVRGSYGHGSPSTVMSQAKRARFGCQGTGVKLARSGIAAMSGEAGAVRDEVVEVPGGDQLRARARVHVHELREEELDPELLRARADLVERWGRSHPATSCVRVHGDD